MLLYNGTNEATARKSLTGGLLPRLFTNRKSNWSRCPSRKDAVYLTAAYAAYFAASSSNSGKWGIVEIDTNKLEQFRFLPDEDFLEQVTRNQNGPWPKTDMVKRTRWFRKNLEKYSHHWTDSINGIGNCAYLGTIPSIAITRVAIFDPKNALRLCWHVLTRRFLH